jgi:hypothetical protein
MLPKFLNKDARPTGGTSAKIRSYTHCPSIGVRPYSLRLGEIREESRLLFEA